MRADPRAFCFILLEHCALKAGVKIRRALGQMASKIAWRPSN